MIVLLVMTDGRRRCIEQTIPSAREQVRGPITRRVLFDDSGDEIYRRWLTEQFPEFELVYHPAGRQGFGGAIRTAWRHLSLCRESYVLHLEDDFTFNRSVELFGMSTVLERFPNVVQMALRRQPWNDDERAAGGIVEQHPADFTEKGWEGYRWLEHRRFFTTNPSLYRRALCARGWPDTDHHSEGIFTYQLLEDPDLRFGFWGARDSGEAVTHIGAQRAGTGY